MLHPYRVQMRLDEFLIPEVETRARDCPVDHAIALFEEVLVVSIALRGECDN